MATQETSEIEDEFARLSPDAQLSLLDRLIHRTRLSMSARADTWEADLTVMASDPPVQRELSRINEEFGATEVDGLERH